MNSLISHLNSQQWPQSANFLSYLIRYLLYAGFWHNPEVSLVNSTEEELLRQTKEIQITLTNANKEFRTLKSESEKLQQLISAKRTELNEIENLRDSARTNREEIETILSESQVKQEALNSIVSKQNNRKEKIDLIIKTFQETDQSIKARFEEIQNQQKSSKEAQEEIESKRDEIIRLTGMAADGSLGHTFKTRFDQLEKSVTIWRYGILAAFLLGLSWYTISTMIIPVPENADAWVFFLFNSLKLTPALILIIWSLKQYGRERGLLEEYAFKTAVAQTVHAYADELANDQYGLTSADFDVGAEYLKYLREREELRKNLVRDTVDQLYRDPRIHEGSSRWMMLRPKAGKEMLVELRNLVKDINSSLR